MRLWGGRFEGDVDNLMRQFNDSFRFDHRLYAADIRGSIAYAGALYHAGLLREDEHRQIAEGLEQVRAEFDARIFEALITDEDIHTAVERRLTEIIGSAAGKLHTGRSRNDQVATDVRLWLLGVLDTVDGNLRAIQSALVTLAEGHVETVMPGYTHLQPAQPITFAHWLLSYAWMLQRDRERLADCRKRTAVLPLGSGALAGNPFAIDRDRLAAELDMTAITLNSLDAVSDRDFAAEFLFSSAMIGLHLSRLAEDLILYSSPGFRFVTLGEAYTTGSSLMPQKRNPDSMELTRGKAGRLVGNLTALMVTLKGLPSTYNKDMQEDKEPLFDTADTLAVMLPVVRGVIETLTIHPTRMKAALNDFMLATDLAEYLVRKGMPFREAHHAAGEAVRLAEERGIGLHDLPPADLQTISGLFDDGAAGVFDYMASTRSRAVPGGTSPGSIRGQIAALRGMLV